MVVVQKTQILRIFFFCDSVRDIVGFKELLEEPRTIGGGVAGCPVWVGPPRNKFIPLRNCNIIKIFHLF